MPINKREVMRAVTFGSRVAEEEPELSSYFVETDQWLSTRAGAIDIVYGAKGSGKSAIYSLLASREKDFSNQGILIAAGEDPRGAPVFEQLVPHPPTSEEEFRALWKLYLLSLVGRQLRQHGLDGVKATRVVQALEQAGLLPKEFSLRNALRSVAEYVRRLSNAESVEGGIQVDPSTGGAIGLTGKITLRDPGSDKRRQGFISADDLLELADDALAEANLTIWLALDRLDVAFAESEELEANALRSLFRVYLDLQRYQQLHLKIFLRSDIWQRITSEGFREASHITRHLTIAWNEESLLNLVVKRMLHNERLRANYSVDQTTILQDVESQRNLFYRVFPLQVDQGPNKPQTFDWMLSRTRDGSGQTAPRELIHLLDCAKRQQLRRWELGHPDPPGEALFDRTALREALPEVSSVRLQQTLFAEYPSYKPWLQKLQGAKTQQTLEGLAQLWDVSNDEASKRTNKLLEVGFFERRGSAYWVPFLYRSALKMVQGSAD